MRPGPFAKEAAGIKKLTVVPLLLLLALAPASARASLEAQPFAGTPDASPQTDVEFPGLAPSQVRSVEVRGSRSGLHRGGLVGLPNGGAAFIPSRPFQDGERVSVHALLTRGSVSFSFGVAAPQPIAGQPVYGVRHDVRDSNGFTHSFHSQSGLHPPIATFSGKVPDPGAGDLFADAENSIQAGPLIFSPQGQLIYFQPLRHAAAFNVEVQSYQGQSVLTYFQGYVKDGVGVGADVILGSDYHTITTVHAGHGYNADLHEFQITPQGNALITAYAQVNHVDLRSVGGPRNGTLLDSIIQEINIATGQVMWEWHAYGHVHVNETYKGKPRKGPYDFFHINSIQQLPNGRLLIAGRNTWALYEVNMKTGRIPLVLGGKHSYFKMGRGTNFEWEHDARLHPDGTITVFDDASAGRISAESQSRALRIRLNYKKHAASLVHAYTNNPSVLAGSQGNVQVMPDGNTFVGWGSAPYFTEFSKSGGRQLFSIHFNRPLQSYRGYRFPWAGQPNPAISPPAVAASRTSSGATIYASWNGATDVSSWRVLAGPARDLTTMNRVRQFRKTNFETTMNVRSSGPYFAVQAIGSGGQVLATSGPTSG